MTPERAIQPSMQRLPKAQLQTMPEDSKARNKGEAEPADWPQKANKSCSQTEKKVSTTGDRKKCLVSWQLLQRKEHRKARYQGHQHVQPSKK